MATIKWKKSPTEWVTLYGRAFRNRLRRDKNLSDVGDKAECRKNLELVDEVTDHYHDARYVPMFNDLRKTIAALQQEVKDTLQKTINELKTTHEIDMQHVDNNFVTVNNRITALEDRVNEMEGLLRSLTERVDGIFDSRGRLTFPNGDKFWVSE